MPEYLAPGVYVEEIDTGSKPIEGVSTSTAGVIGVTERGPVNVPILLTSLGEYTRWFGERLSFGLFDDHCFVPYAVEGFFTNGGKRMYLTRIIDTDAALAATANLFDRGGPLSADTMVLRSVGEQTGTLANQPLLYVLDVSDVNVGDNIRVGDGSHAEYRIVTAIGTVANNTHVPLSFPLAMSHAAGIANSAEHFPHAVDAAFGAQFTLQDPASAGDEAIVVAGAAADITALDGAANPLIEIGAAQLGEHRYVDTVTVLAGGTTARVTLFGGGLVMPYAAGLAVQVIDLAGGPTQQAMLTPAANAGDQLIFVDDRNGDFDTQGDIVILDGANPDPSLREARRIGVLGTLQLNAGASELYAAGSVVEVVTLGDDDRSLAAATAIGATTITLTNNDVTELVTGTQLTIDTGANQEPTPVSVLSIDTTVPAPFPVTIAPALTVAHAAGAAVVPDFSLKTLAADAAAGSSVINLLNRVSLDAGDVLRIGVAPAVEYAVVAAIPNPAAAGADPGNVLLDHPLQMAHFAGTEVRRQNLPAATADQATVLALDAESSATAVLVTDGTNYSANDFIRITSATGEEFFHQLTANFAAASPAEVTVDAVFNLAHPASSPLVSRTALIDVDAIDVGEWGNRLRISIEDENPGVISRTTLSNVIDPTHIRLASAAGVESGTVLELLDPLADDAVSGDPLKVELVDRQANFTITLRAPGLSAAQQAAQVAAQGAGTRLGVRSREFRIAVYLLHQPDPARPSRNDLVIDSEVFRQLSMDPRHSRYAPTVIGDINGPLRRADRRPEGESAYIRISDLTPSLDVRLGPETLTDLLPNGQRRAARHPLFGGDDSIATLTDATYIGTDNVDPDLRTGLFTLVNVEDISIIAAPGRTSATMQGSLIAQCENLRYRFAVLDGPEPPGDSIPDVQDQRQNFDTKYAALYYPWLLVDDPYPVNLQNIGTFPLPPAGHVMGIYARTDIERGVHKAPANEVVRGIIGLQRLISKGEQEILNPFPSNINVIRDFRPNNRSIRVWGGRVITSDPDWKYVNVRRLLIFIERSIDLGLQWVVFEPNSEPLWARVRRTISNFLTTVWRNGALEGTKREEAYFVKCDRTTMTQADIDNGRLIVVIGVAPVKPAEFVIIRIGLFTAHAED
jgi:phage tail sheath protein FI